MSFTCPVCGYLGLVEPPRDQSGGASLEICPSCFFQFGYDDDDQGWTYLQWRQRWVERHCPWSSSGQDPPEGWDGAVQLHQLLEAEALGQSDEPR